MTERPILFSGPMVRAILAGTKTQTRRLVRFKYGEGVDGVSGAKNPPPRLFVSRGDQPTGMRQIECPYGGPGDRLWVRETWALVRGGGYNSFVGDYEDLDFHETKIPADSKPRGYSTVWRADDGWDDYSREDGAFWRPSIHMPRWASRLSLEVVSVRVERSQEISEADAKAEGVTPLDSAPPGFLDYNHLDPDHTHRGAFAQLWDVINGERAAWKSNPWVWRVEFHRAEVL